MQKFETGALGKLHLSALQLGDDWNIPVFNFGRLNDINQNHPLAWNSKQYDALWGRARDLVSAGEFLIPFDRCLYVFHYAETETRFETVNLIHLVREDGLINGEVFSWTPAAPGAMALWVKEPIQFAFSPGGSGIEYGIDPRVSHAEDQEAFWEDVRSQYSIVMAATMMLNCGAAERKEAKTLDIIQINRERRQRRDEALAPIIIVKPDRVALTNLALTPTGRVQQPHDRRGHWRTLESGRLVPVRPAKIHGGAGTARTYVVHPPVAAQP